MLLLDVAHRTWSKKLLSALELDIDLLAKCYESEEVTGRLTPEAAELLGLSTDCVVVGGAGDCAAGAVGNGIVARGVLEHVDRHLRRDVRPLGRGEDRSPGPGPHVLPCRSRQVAHDGREPVGRRLAAMVPQRVVQGRRGGGQAGQTRNLRPADRRGPSGAAGQRGAVLPALSLRRADAARRSRRPGLLRRPDGRPHAAGI